MVEETQNFIKRDILRELKNHLNKKEMTFIAGPRQVGKTTLMKVLKKGLDAKEENTLFLSLDFENDKKFFVSQNALIERIKLEFGKKKGYVFLDEIQRKENAGIFLKGIFDMDLPYKFIVSGSGSMELKEKIHESLMGRKAVFDVYPVSFAEFTNYKTDYKYESSPDKYFSVERDKAAALFGEYMNFGGYPRVILEESLEDKTRIIADIYSSYLEKDASFLLGIEKLDAFSSLVKLLAGRVGKIMNHSEISDALGVSVRTLKNYLWYLEKTFIIHKVTPYFQNIRKEITKSPTVYFYDLGLRNYSLGIFGNALGSESVGFLFQNFVFNVLKQNIGFSGAKINFWRTKDKAEVDFVVNFGEKIMPVEVKYKDLKKPKVERALRSFIGRYKPEKALIVNKSLKDEMNIDKTKVEIISFYDLIFLRLWNRE